MALSYGKKKLDEQAVMNILFKMIWLQEYVLFIPVLSQVNKEENLDKYGILVVPRF